MRSSRFAADAMLRAAMPRATCAKATVQGERGGSGGRVNSGQLGMGSLPCRVRSRCRLIPFTGAASFDGTIVPWSHSVKASRVLFRTMAPRRKDDEKDPAADLVRKALYLHRD